jgi:hypothetical protein
MPRKAEVPIALPYAPPRPKATRPPLLAAVATVSSLLGALVFGAVLPWAALRYGFVYDGEPSLVGAALLLVIGILIGAVVGALVVPAIVLSGYWIIWRLAGRP